MRRGVELTSRVDSPSCLPRRLQPGMMHVRADANQIRPSGRSLQMIGQQLGVELRQVEIDQNQLSRRRAIHRAAPQIVRSASTL